ncbi:MAG: FTR1 family protein [Brumimicrobium sp.]|nr:FTR1 family protein [Brumimicrobium sp.]
MVKRFVILVILLQVISIQNIFSQGDEKNAETVIHLLSYISIDYTGAVQNGEVINQLEYIEQQEFSQQALSFTQKSSFLKEPIKSQVTTKIQQLIQLINEKADNAKIVKIINEINSSIIETTGIQTAPKSWPSLTNGKKLYDQTCASCHGLKGKGDGEMGKSLDPSPSDFTDHEAMSQFSPFQALNTIRLGLPGTGMQAYSFYNESDLWDLAFFVKSLSYSAYDTTLLRKEFNEIAKHIDISQIANLNDEELIEQIQKISTKNIELKLQALRILTPSSSTKENSIPIAVKGLKDALESYKKGNKGLARTHAITAYLEGVEPIESQLKIINPDFVGEIEAKMFNVRSAIVKNVSVDELEASVDEAIEALNKADKLLKGQSLNYWLTFILAASIMLREGLEAFLILAVVLALIRSLDVKKALPWVHGGWILAVLLGIVGWYLSDLIIQFGGKNREIMEGLVSILAVIILMFVGFWLHTHTTAKKWQEFVQNKIGVHLKSDRMYGLAAFSFMIVFREVFEVILFLQAINLEAGPENKSALGLGVIAASIVIALIAYLFLKSTKKLPIRQLFQYSSWFIVILAVILLGKGVHSLQESGWISVTPVSIFPRIDWLGFYASIETIISQLGLILIILTTFFISKRKNKEV